MTGRTFVVACVACVAIWAIGCAGAAKREDRSGPATTVASDPAPDLDAPPLTRALPHTMSATNNRTCVLDAQRAQWCWGHGLAPGGRDQLTPRKLAEGIVAIAGRDGVCTVRSDGTGWCNDASQPLKHPIDLGAGSNLACALARDTSVACWGGNRRGAPPIRGASQISVGTLHACARLVDGTAYCWGQNFLNRLGAANPDATSARVPLTEVAGVSAGDAHSCAWKTDGTVWCWGNRHGGVLGVIPSGGYVGSPTPVQIAGLANIRAVSSGFSYACAIDGAGAVFCWGNNAHGEIVAEGRELPATKIDLPAPIVELATGATHVCARDARDGIWCWGSSSSGQLGAGDIGTRPWPEKVALVELPDTQQRDYIPPARTKLASGATRIEYRFDGKHSLPGWERAAGGQSSFDNGQLVLRAFGHEQWRLRAFSLDAGMRWAVEARFALDRPCDKPASGLRIDDGARVVSIHVTDRHVKGAARYDIGPTHRMRTYRVESDGRAVTVLVDGKRVGDAEVATHGNGAGLAFGVFGDGCGRDASTWQSLAYEVFPLPTLAWPRGDWHPATPQRELISAITSALPNLGATLPPLSADDVPCLAMIVVDGAVRDLLASEYDASNRAAASELRRLGPLTDAHAIDRALIAVRHWQGFDLEPTCTPAPGGHCPPPRAPTPRAPTTVTGASIASALEAARGFGRHPLPAIEATRLAASAYASALHAKLPGAGDALKRLAKRLASLPGTQRCGL